MRGRDWPVLGAVALGGGTGALARYGVSVAWPTAPGGFPWATLWTNVLGCAVIGVLLVLLDAAVRPRRLVRPFFGTGVLGGFTTFSTFAVDVRTLVGEGAPLRAAVYLVATPAAALTAVALGAWTTGRVLERRAPGR
ncbi:chromosome condensation protein CrcB [Streptomyces sp. CC53]|uniref:fluoride efflux transporter FluC n=1 Tax=unclassified Streptomyces TaxID=2593676 RepID=UPI0008DE70EF|nr:MULTISPECIES: CrcB family protein [unclassified Streptomyces]OII60926.1 chromosome condensation protein CrcB [Streptomyces sp. CC53]